jgi:hypothetical protein
MKTKKEIKNNPTNLEVEVCLETQAQDSYNILSINGVDIITVIYNSDTGMYHWNGDANYSGHTLQECIERSR